jgi:dipeptidase D
LTVCGLLGGHSGVEIDKGRVNSNILMGRILFHMEKEFSYDIKDVCGGDKDNVITSSTKAELLVSDTDNFTEHLNKYLKTVKAEMSSREPNLNFIIDVTENCTEQVISPEHSKKIVRMLTCTPSGIMKMSADIKGLVETSLNLGVISTTKSMFKMCYALRSNKQTALCALEEKMYSFASVFEAICESSGHYPPWEFVNNSEMQNLYIETFEEMFGKKPSVEAIHAGLECGMFSAGLPGLDCISFGPVAIDIHSVNERLSISSTKETFELVKKLLCKMK